MTATSLSVWKSRFAPSPTGLMHLGSVRTALFNALLVQAHVLHGGKEGTFLLRIEDTDTARSERQWTEALLNDLHWLGIEWQEGPFHQSERKALYETYYQRLIQGGQAYWCYCSEAELMVQRKTQLSSGTPPRYLGTCRHLSLPEQEAKMAKGIKPALRFRVPPGETIAFEDWVQGPKHFDTQIMGDFIIKKADGSAAFFFCNALDDALMGVTHVLRGEDHLTNTPRQLLILKSLGLPSPYYGHMPLIVGFDGKPLSKRNGSHSVAELRDKGYLPLAILNYLARLGHRYTQEHLLSLEGLAQHFCVKQITHSPARFDELQLRYWQKEALKQCSEATFWEWITPFLDPQCAISDKALFAQTFQPSVLFPQEASEWAKRLFSSEWTFDLFSKEARALLEQPEIPAFLGTFSALVEEEGDHYEPVITRLAKDTQRKGKALFSPVRAVVTGCLEGPELAKIFRLLGKERLLLRLEKTKQLIA